MRAFRYALRAGLGLLLLVGGFVVPVMVAHAGVSPDFRVTVNDASPDGPDPVTVGFDVSYDVRVKNNAVGPFAPDIDAQTTGNHFVSWYSNDAWTCGPPSSVSLGAPIIVRQNDLSGNEVECTRSAMASGGVSHLHLIVRAPGAPGTFDLGVTELNTDANASEQTTAQDNQSGDDATGFLPPDGGKIRTDGQPTPGDDTNSSIRTFLGSGPGGVFKLHDGASPQDICGGQPCDGKVVEVDIPDGYNDKQQPPKLKLIYDETAAGAGVDATIWIKKDDQDPQIVPACDVDGIAKPHPCHGPVRVKHNGDVRYVVYLLSGDPLTAKH